MRCRGRRGRIYCRPITKFIPKKRWRLMSSTVLVSAAPSVGTKLRHVYESQQFTVPLLMELFDRTRQMEKIVARGGTLDYQNRIMATLFYEPSTRTRFSFEAAMH